MSEEGSRFSGELIMKSIAQYKDESKQIATKFANEQIRHNKAIASILSSEKAAMIDRLAKGLLSPRGGHGGKNKREGQGEGKGQKRRRRSDNVKIAPAHCDVEIDIPE